MFYKQQMYNFFLHSDQIFKMGCSERNRSQQGLIDLGLLGGPLKCM